MAEYGSRGEEGLKKLAEGVYAFIGHEGDSNYGLLDTADGPVVIDNDIRCMAQFAQAIQATVRQPVKYLINTHHAFDHSSANHFFAGKNVTIISSIKCREMMAELGEKILDNYRASDPRVRVLTEGAGVILPNLTFDGQLSLHLGKHFCELSHFGQAHTPGDIIVYLPQEKILFAGDLIVNRYHPQVRDGNLTNWLFVLEQLEKMAIETIVPGHGYLVDKKGISQLKNYFATLEKCVQAFVKDGKSVEDIQREIALPDFHDWGKIKFLPNTLKAIHARVMGHVHL